MKKKILSILTLFLLLSLLSFTVTACGEPPHVHTYDKEIATSNYLFKNATCDDPAEYFYSCECGEEGTLTFKHGEKLGHAYGDWASNGDGTHTKTCANDNNHKITENCTGGEATCTKKAVCDDCGTEYGTTDEHNYTELKHNETEHWYECTCGDKKDIKDHIPGESATETTDQKCTICQQVITPALGHVHTLHLTKVDAKPQSCTEEGNIEYYTCSCGKWFTDNTATTEITDKTSVVIEKDAHKYETLIKTSTEHWWECSCGAYETKENHKGGTATCQVKATCSVCDTIYGDFAEHEPKTAWITTDTHHYHECIYGCTEKLNYAEHSFTNYVSNKDATFESDGTKTAKCDSGCGITHTVTDEGSMLIKDEIRFTTLNVSGKDVYGKVSNATTTFSFVNEITRHGKADYVVSLDEFGIQTSLTKSAPLTVGDNVIYIFETIDGEITNTYKITIRRRVMYTVTFNTDGGSIVGSQTIEEDSFATVPNAPTKTAYEFDSWEYDFNTPITSNTTISAKWNATKYDINYNLNGGTLSTFKNEYTIEQNVIFDNPTRDYYTFSGWYENANFSGNVITGINKGTYGEKTYYAKWTPTDYVITYKLNGAINDINNPKKYNIETSTITLKDPSREAFTFDGWYLDETFDTEVTEIKQGSYGDVTLYPKWNAIVYDIVYNLNGGSLSTTKNSYNIEQAVVFDEPTRDYYTFSGWYNNADFNGNAITEIVVGTYGDLELYAKWTPVNYVIEYELNGGVNNSANPNKYTVETSTIVLKKPTKEGYTFIGWYKEDTFETRVAIISMGTHKDYKLYAKWEITEYNILYEVSGGKYTADKNTYTIEDQVSFGTPSRDNYSFAGWYLNPYYSGKPVTGINKGTSGDVVVYAKWIPIEYTIEYELNGGENDVANITTYNVETATFTLKDPVRTGYSFYGWYLEEGFDTKLEKIEEGSFGDIKLYAKWEINQYSITIVYGNGQENKVITQDYNTNITEILPEMTGTRPGYTFDGWDKEMPLTMQAEDLTITAKWLAIFKVSNGNISGLTDYGKTFTDIVIPGSIDGVTIKGINASAFFNHTLLKSIEIPNSVTSIGDSAFYGCASLTKVNYTGTIDQWAMIEFGGPTANLIYYSNNLYINNVLVTEVNLTTATSIGDYAFEYCSSLTSVTIGDSVESIGNYAFRNCTSLTSVTIGDSVESIGSYAFRGCNKLESITLPFVGSSLNGTEKTHFGYIFGASSSSYNSDYVPESLKKVTIIGGAISENAFYKCSSLTSVTIGDSITSIGEDAFSGCSSLEAIEIPNSVTSIGRSAFNGCIALESVTFASNSKLESIGNYAFDDCSSLTSIEIPDSVTSIGLSAFEGCSSLESITLPFIGATKDGTTKTHFGYIFGASYYFYNSDYVPASLKKVTIIGGAISEYAFYECESLTSVVIPNSVTSIEYGAFEHCSALESVTFDSNSKLESIGDRAFYNCTSLTSIVIPDSVTSIGGSAFYNCESLISVVIGNNVTGIGESTFYDCSSLTSVVIGNSVTCIDRSAFNGCIALECVTFASNSILESIGGSAFRGCKELTNVVIPNSLTSIGDYAFYGCNKLVEVVNKSTYITVIKGSESNGYVGYYALAVYNSGDTYTSKLSNDNGYIIYTDGDDKILVGYNGQETDLIIPNYVTEIYKYAFYYCDWLTSIEIPNGVKSIGNSAFCNCDSLTSIKIPSSVKSIGGYSFYLCSYLASVVIEDGVTNIREWAFRDCVSLTSIVIPNTIESIDDGAFGSCDSLVSIYYTGTIDSWVQIEFENELANPLYYAKKLHINNELVTEVKLTTATKISSYAFSGYDSLISIETSNSVENIYPYAFYNCDFLISVILGDSVKIIGEYAFYDCGSLASVAIGDGIERIGDNAFSDCSSLKSIEIGNGLTSIGSYAFFHCNSLAKVCYLGTIDSWAQIEFCYDFSNPLFYAKNLYINNELVTEVNLTTAINVTSCAFSNCESITSVVIGDSVGSIGMYAFDGCSLLESIEISKSVAIIEDMAFYNCTSLTSVYYTGTIDSWAQTEFGGWFANPLYYAKKLYINNELITEVKLTTATTISNYAFYNCTSLTSIVIPNSVTSIGMYAFEGCSSLTSIVIPNSVTSIGYSAFSGCSSLTIYCEAESKPSGWNSGWNISNLPVVWGYKGN